MKGVAVASVVARNFIAYARVLADSLRRFHPGVPLKLVVADEDDLIPASKEPFEHVPLADLRIPVLASMQAGYNRQEMVIALKPALIRYLLEEGHQSVVFLDADILVLASLQPVFDVVARHALTVTPHVGPPRFNSGRFVRENELLLAGMYNGGFVGAAARPETWRFLEWWEGRLRTHCTYTVHRGIYYDQRWLDLAPGFVEDLHILRDPGSNVAYWNLPDRTVEFAGEEMLVDGVPCRFFHFSGFDTTWPERVTRYKPHLRVADLGPTAALFRRYAELLEAAGHSRTLGLPWGYERGWRARLRGALQRLRP
jgi:hypothetical protein